MSSPEETNTGPVIRDLRRIDPVTGQVRGPGQAESPQGGGGRRPGKDSVSVPGAADGTDGAGAGEPRPPADAGPEPGPGGPSTPREQPAAGRGKAGQAPAAGRGKAGQAPAGTGGAMADELAERTLDLQRVTAEYANYRKRVERDRIAVREQALANVLSGLLPVLDDIGRAREHGELVGGFKSVAESLEASAAKLGLSTFGEEGERFDPNVHEALMHSYSPDVTEPSCVRILQPGYRVGDRILRPARVAVAEPGEVAAGGEPGEATGDGGPGEAAAGGGPGSPAAGTAGAQVNGEGAGDSEAAGGSGWPADSGATGGNGTAGQRQDPQGSDD